VFCVNLDGTHLAKLRDDLAALHLRSIVGLKSSELTSVVTATFSEPVLALAAWQVLWRSSFKDVLEQFCCSDFCAHADLRLKGEFAAQLLTVLAYRISLSSLSMFSDSFAFVSLDYFIETAFRSFLRYPQWKSESSDTQAKTAALATFGQVVERLSRMWIRALQVVQLDAFLPTAGSLKKLLFDYFMRGNVLKCKRKQAFVDLVIPICVFDDGESLREATVDRMGALFIRAQLRKEPIPAQAKAGWRKALCEKFKSIEFVAFFCEFGPTGAESAEFEVDIIESPAYPIRSSRSQIQKHVFFSVRNWKPSDVTGHEFLDESFAKLISALLKPQSE
jgi:hypothetical protein